MATADQIVSAVLEATNKAYIVEQGQDESGNWFRRFSNGWVEQGGYLARNNSPVNVVFPVAFSGTDYSVVFGGTSTRSLFATAAVAAAANLQPTSMDVYIGSHLNGCFWEAKGFAA